MKIKTFASNLCSNVRSLFTTKLAANHEELYQTVYAMAAKVEELEDRVCELNRSYEEFTETPPEIDYDELASCVDTSEAAEEIANHLDLTDLCEYIDVDEDEILKALVDRIQITIGK